MDSYARIQESNPGHQCPLKTTEEAVLQVFLGNGTHSHPFQIDLIHPYFRMNTYHAYKKQHWCTFFLTENIVRRSILSKFMNTYHCLLHRTIEKKYCNDTDEAIDISSDTVNSETFARLLLSLIISKDIFST